MKVITTNGLPLKALQVAAGDWHTIVIDLNNDVWGFGDNRMGQLGLGDSEGEIVPTKLDFKAKQVSARGNTTLLIDMENNVWIFGETNYSQPRFGYLMTPTQVMISEIPLKAQQVSAGQYFVLIVDLNNDVWTFGNGNNGELGVGDNQDRHVPIQILNFKAEQVSAGDIHSIMIATKIF